MTYQYVTNYPGDDCGYIGVSCPDEDTAYQLTDAINQSHIDQGYEPMTGVAMSIDDNYGPVTSDNYETPNWY